MKDCDLRGVDFSRCVFGEGVRFENCKLKGPLGSTPARFPDGWGLTPDGESRGLSLVLLRPMDGALSLVRDVCDSTRANLGLQEKSDE